jgi:hypothetical protein
LAKVSVEKAFCGHGVYKRCISMCMNQPYPWFHSLIQCFTNFFPYKKPVYPVFCFASFMRSVVLNLLILLKVFEPVLL